MSGVSFKISLSGCIGLLFIVWLLIICLSEAGAGNNLLWSICGVYLGPFFFFFYK